MSANLKKLNKRGCCASPAKRMIEGERETKPLRRIRKRMSNLSRLCGPRYHLDPYVAARNHVSSEALKRRQLIRGRKCAEWLGDPLINYVAGRKLVWRKVYDEESAAAYFDNKKVGISKGRVRRRCSFCKGQHTKSAPPVVAARRALNVNVDVHRPMEVDRSPPPQQVPQQQIGYVERVRLIFMPIFVGMLIAFACHSAGRINNGRYE